MAGQVLTILLAEDNPVERKLLGIRLTQMGYQVVAVADGVEALERTRTQRPDLVVSDVLMPRLDGFRLCRTLRRDPELGAVPVVLISSANIEEDDRLLALEMGASAFVPRTPDCREIIEAIQASLQEGAPPACAQDAEWLAEMRSRFLNEGGEECRVMLEALESGFDPVALRQLTHRWAGVGGTLGFPQISQRAYELEKLCERPFEEPSGALRAPLEQIHELFADAARAAWTALAASAEVMECLQRKQVVLVGFAPPEATVLSRALERAGAVPQVLSLEAAAPHSPALASTDLIILLLEAQASHSSWLEAEALAAKVRPLLVVGSRELLFRAGAVVRKRAADFLLAPWSLEEALLRAARILRRAPAPEPAAVAGERRQARVLVADDDPAVVALVSATMNNYGLPCDTALDGAQALEMTRTLRPSLLVLDINLPAVDGFEVLAKLKRDPETRDIPVVLLSARQQEADVLRGFGLGAADYVVKPFGPLELVARVRRLLGAQSRHSASPVQAARA